MVFTACAQPPEGSRDLTPEEEAVVDAVIDELDVTTPVVERLLEKANPLFDRNGRPVADNAQLSSSLYEVLDKIHQVSDAGRILMARAEDMEEAAAAARGSGSEGLPVDDYLLIREPDDGYSLYLAPETLFHEGAHYLYGRHRWASESRVTQELQSADLNERLQIGLEKKDLPYTLEPFFLIGGLWYGYTDWSRHDTDTLIEHQLPVVDETMAQSFIDDQRALLEEELDRDTWAKTMAEYAVRTYGSDGADLLDPLGMTQEELEETLLQADELFEIQQENTQEALELLREADAQYMPESSSELRSAMGARR